LKPPRIACRVPNGDGNVNGFYRTGCWRATGRGRAEPMSPLSSAFSARFSALPTLKL
jgi:hypothetical protein